MMKKIEWVLLLTTATALAQAPAPKPPTVPAKPTALPQTFTHLEEAMVKEINTRHGELQELIYELMDEVKRAHPGYEFSNGSLVPIPPPAPKAKEEKKP